MSIHYIPKPEGSTWTDDQWNAIAVRGHSMLVAAAAGSGKTAVLVERIIRRIADESDPVDVDRLLVATFTKAAAAEMRHRIAEALEKALNANPESEHLRKQLALIPRASITTLHSFCMEVIQRHYQRVGLDPGFRIANETETALMRQDLLEDLLEEKYGASPEDDPFWLLADSFSGDKSDDALFKLIQRLYDDSRSHPWPEDWLQDCAAMFTSAELTEENPWVSSLKAYLRVELQGAQALLEEAEETAMLPSGPDPYLANLQDDLAVVRGLRGKAEASSWAELYEAFQMASFGKLKACKGDGYDKELQERVKELRGEAKDRIADLKEELFSRTPEQYAAELRTVAPLMKLLVDVVLEFGGRFRKAKLAKGLVDFADLEHYCLRILCGEGAGPGGLTPSAAALEYREQFVEVLLDEYQDTNRVQEAIVELIARETPGNRFMVGDVKQSIYRFRLAEPGLFQEKYKSYLLDGTQPGQRIDLARNFRSRRQVVDGTNYIFRQLMSEGVGEIDYDERAELAYGAGYPDPAPGSEDFSADLVLIDRSAGESAGDAGGDEAERPGKEEGAAADDLAAEAAELEAVQLEARYIAQRIRHMMAMDGGKKLQVYDKGSQGTRDVAFRDIVILLRATQQWGPVLIEELRGLGIPAYAELNTGYFTAVEVQMLLSLLQIIDNPYQDIPLASVLRSPIAGLEDEELAHIRICRPHGSFYDAVRAYARQETLDAEGAAKPAADEEAAGTTGIPPAGESVVGASGSLLSAAASESGEDAPYPASASDSKRLDSARSDLTRSDSETPLPTRLDFNEEPPCEQDGGFARREELQAKLLHFLGRLRTWRAFAQQGSVADLIWRIYRETKVLDFVGGLPGGGQRQANLRALYDRARQYENTSFRGLFRFLRFIERMQRSGGDLGAARALGEQEDVVRIMTIHKSKGLEFPVVFVAGLNKGFNRRDLTDPFLLHKELGFGPKLTDTEHRVSYPTLPWLAIKRKIGMEMLAEEMRVLYVALTRAREKLILVASVRSAEKLAKSWTRFVRHKDARLPDDALAKARNYLDWVGPAVIRHPDAEMLRAAADTDFEHRPFLDGESSRWNVRLIRGDLFAGMAQAAAGEADFSEERWEQVQRYEPVEGTERYEAEVWRRLDWTYPGAGASQVLSKTSVTELKRLSEHHKLLETLSEEPSPTLWGEADGRQGTIAAGELAESGTGPGYYRPVIVRRPRFLEQEQSNAAERGTVFHSVMQQIPLKPAPTEEQIRETLAAMVARELLTPAQMDMVDPAVILSFFGSVLGARLQQAVRIHREVPFSCAMRAADVNPSVEDLPEDETVMLQGVIDCLIDEGDGLVLLDYKTDRLKGGSPQAAAGRYKMQLELYARAVEKIWKRPVTAKYIFLFDGAHIVEL
ncbi:MULTISPECIES: helicase-exonuclease AddAB subunit AddA [Paenibacillus]|uniref:helicase-exonuclease AddAB subunit AddA n=1 Tax=Paenibacillus TaxID=44249 RepID=UPI0022B88908|nr:helicase-exonuclease AddAB subunit AddA [Paenibacillus caseinilyticus]MCZ8518709.1 helicase-exonuclease AddAB subunit AddA [Paenibacillus caseinilyticus]